MAKNRNKEKKLQKKEEIKVNEGKLEEINERKNKYRQAVYRKK